MPISENREYRAIPMAIAEKRAEGDEPSFFVEGYASTFEAYELFNDGGIRYMERIEPTAFDDCDMSDVIFQKDHQGTVMARTGNGSITLDVDEHGLHHRTDLGRTEAARQMYDEIKAEMYTQMSFAFVVDNDEIQKDSAVQYTRVIKHVRKLYDISAVSFPANPGTDIGVSARSLFDGFIEQEAQEMRERQKAEELERLRTEYFNMEV